MFDEDLSIICHRDLTCNVFAPIFFGGVLVRASRTKAGPETLDAANGRWLDKLLELPSKREAEKPVIAEETESDDESLKGREAGHDPIRLLRGLEMRQYLRSGRVFWKVWAAGGRFYNPTAPPRSAKHDPGRTTFDRAQSQLDMVDMLLQRRHFHADRVANAVESIWIYTDSSPVTGEELQGSVMDVILHDRTYRRTILPGASLSYGLFSAIQKGVTLLWSLFFNCWTILC